MSEQVKEPSKAKRTFSLILNILFLISMAFFLYTCFFVDKPRDETSSQKNTKSNSIDFTTMSEEEAIEAIKKLNPKIKDVTFIEPDNVQAKYPQISYRCDVVKNPLAVNADDLKDITHAIVTAKGAEEFSFVHFLLFESGVDKYNNKSDVLSAHIAWQKKEYKNINWKGFKGWQFLPLASFFEAKYPFGTDMVKTYCSDGTGFNDEFCKRPDVSRYLY